ASFLTSSILSLHLFNFASIVPLYSNIASLFAHFKASTLALNDNLEVVSYLKQEKILEYFPIALIHPPCFEVPNVTVNISFLPFCLNVSLIKIKILINIKIN